MGAIREAQFSIASALANVMLKDDTPKVPLFI